MATFIYLTAIFIELIFLLFFCVYVLSLLYSVLRGAFYVPTKQKEIDDFLGEAGLKKGRYLLELGSGDGRVLRCAARIYGVVGKGIDINPTLNLLARFHTRRQKLKDIVFTTENVKTTDFSKADVIYIFLMPKLIKTFDKRLLKESKRKTLIISHGFEVHTLFKYRFKTIEHKPFSTYFYKIP